MVHKMRPHVTRLSLTRSSLHISKPPISNHPTTPDRRFLFPTGVPERLLGQLHCIDIQETAIENTRRQLLEKAGAPLNPDPSAMSGALAVQPVHSFHPEAFRLNAFPS